MALRPFLRRHRRTLTGSVSVATIVAVVALIGVVSRGFDHLEPLLDDGSAWVSNASLGMLGHANTPLLRLDTAVPGISGDTEVLQDDHTVSVHNRSKNTIDVLDAASATISDSVPLPAGNPEVTLAASTFVIWQPVSGDVWTVPSADIKDFSALTAPTLNLGTDITFAVDNAGNYAGFSSASGDLVQGSLRQAEKPRTGTVPVASAKGAVQVSLVGGEPVVYQEDSADLLVNGRHLDLSEQVSDPSSVRLMAPSVAPGAVLLAHSAGALSVAPGADTAQAVAVPAGVETAASAPVRVSDCDYLAWAGGQALRRCDNRDARELTLDSADASKPGHFAVHGATVVLTEPNSGNSWAVQKDGEIMANWADFTNTDTPTETVENNRDAPPELLVEQKPPVAVDDAFGARPGRGNVLPVLLNDSDPNGDALMITRVTEIPAESGALSIIADGQKVQFVPGTSPPPAVSFRYTIDDGFGNSASANVTVTLRADGENSAPVQARASRTSVERGGSVRTDVLEDWVDPDSDPIFLAGATVAAPDTVAFAPAGMLTYTEAGGTGELRTITTSVSDGTLTGVGSVTVTTGAPGTIPLVAESFSKVGFARQDILVEPLTVVRGGSGAPVLTGVTVPGHEADVRITPDYVAGTFTVSANAPGSYLLEYAVADGTLTATGTVRLEVSTAPEGQSVPVTAPVTAFLYLQNTTVVDVLASAYDPAGGVLTISGVDTPSAESGVLVETVDFRVLRVTLRTPLHGEPLTIGFTVSNGVSTAPGTLTIIEVPEPTRLQAPVAVADSAEVRVGSVVTIPVLKNDSQPDGKPLILEPELSVAPGEGEGTLFVSGDSLRYLAPDTAGTYSARYRVSSTDGQWAEANVTLTVRDIDAANNRAPVPATLTARVLAGKTVQISVPLTGIDPDGDSVTLVGAQKQPTLGAMGSGGLDYLEYTAAPYSSGTDEIEYTVIDALGAVGTGLVRVGVLPAAGAVAPPVAVDDLVSARPGVELTIPVTDNDSDPENSALSVVSVEATSDNLAETFTAKTVSVTAPAEPGSYGVLYTITNARGATSSAWLYLHVSADAPLARPIARDITLTSSDVGDRSSMTVDPLSAASFTEGTRADLDLRLVGKYPGATLEDDGRVTVAVQTRAHVVPFEVFRRDAPEIGSIALIWVPGTEDSHPELRTGVAALTVVSGEQLSIALKDYVMSPTGGALSLVDTAPVTATHASGDPLTGGGGLVFRSAPDYWGAASITFTVTDKVGDVGGSATLTLPITVTPADQQPPTLTGANLSLEPGTEHVVQLRALTDFLYPDRADALRYEATSDAPDVITAVVSGQKLSLSAADGAKAGSHASVLVSVFDGTTAGKSAVIQVQIVRSTRPLLSPIPDNLTLKRGTSAPVSVLANDEATNPFPGKPLRVHSVGAGISLPSGVSVSTSADKSTVTVAVAHSAATGTITIPYTVMDVTESTDRLTSGYITVQIEDVPEAPGVPRILSTDIDKASVTLAIPHAFANFSPITSYTVTADGSGPGAVCENPDHCVVSGLEYGTASRFRATATNALGTGDPSGLSAPALVDGTPVSPSGLALTPANRDNRSALVATWAAGSGSVTGSALAGYDVKITGPGVSVSSTVSPQTGEITITDGVQGGQNYTLSVIARNKTSSGPAATTSAVAVGAPTMSRVSVAMSFLPGLLGAEVSWEGLNLRGGTRSAIRVDASGSQPACAPNISANAQGNSYHVSRAQPGDVFVVTVSNGLFCTQMNTNEVGPLPQMGHSTSSHTETSADGDQRFAIQGQSATMNAQFQIAIRPEGEPAPAIDSGAWQTYGGSVAASDGQFGRSQQIYVRACLAHEGGSCSTPVPAGGPVTAYRTRAVVQSCPVPGQKLGIRLPDNNGVRAGVEVLYYGVHGHSSTPITGVWVSATDPVPPFPAGADHMQVRVRAILGGHTYEAPENTLVTCAGVPAAIEPSPTPTGP